MNHFENLDLYLDLLINDIKGEDSNPKNIRINETTIFPHTKIKL